MDEPKDSSDGSELDFINHWVGHSVQEEIHRGNEIRDKKDNSDNLPEYDVVDIHFIKPPPYCAEGTHSRKRLQTKIHAYKTGSYENNLIISKSRNNHIKARRYRNNKSRQKCPMRVVELAVPTKRQCLETWKNKYHVLPDIMIDRLKQHVLDEKPVVKISDAIHSFRKPKMNKNIKKKKETNLNTLPTYQNYENGPIRRNKIHHKKYLKLSDIRNFCAVFGHNVALKLNKPLVITLNSRLQSISKLVSVEIASLILKSKTINHKYLINNQVFLEDTAGKIAIWIHGILEEAYYKILEDQLRDFEEEAGPALDVLDDLVDGILDLCVPDVVSTYSDLSKTIEKEKSEEFDVEYENVEDNDTDTKDKNNYHENVPFKESISRLITTIKEDHGDSINDHIRSELNSILNDISQLDDTNLIDTQMGIPQLEINNDKETNEFVDASDNFDEFNHETVDNGVNNVIDKSWSNNEELKHSEENNDFLSDNVDQVNIGNIDEIMNKENAAADGKNELDPDKENFNVSDFSEDFIDAKDKKVKFSKTNMVTNEDNQPMPSAGSHPKLNEDYLHEFIFAEPNLNLLSDVDEAWPDDLNTPMLRPSASVSKSITSLGNISEVDEAASLVTYILDFNIETNHEVDVNEFLNKEHVDNNVEKGINEKTESSTNNINVNKTNVEADTLKQITTQETKHDINNGLVREDEEHVLVDILKPPVTHALQQSKDKQNNKKTKQGSLKSQSLGKIENDSGLKATNVKFYSVRHKPKPNYKVRACTAPAWVKQGHGESTESTKCDKINEHEIRNWCKDLQQGFDNLELWKDWLNITANNIKNLKYSYSDKCPCAHLRTKKIQKWRKLEKCIATDISTWNKIRKTYKNKLDSYKNVFNKTVPSVKLNCLCSKYF